MSFMNLLTQKFKKPEPGMAISGRTEPIPTAELHAINQRHLKGPYPENCESVILGLGCFWGAERKFWQLDGVWITAVGYAGGETLNPTYNEVCTGRTGHTEVVKVVFDPSKIKFENILKVFWESHDPTQGMRQGNDVGTQYRSAIYCESQDQLEIAQQTAKDYQNALSSAKYGAITTEIAINEEFYFAEDYHQQYLQKNPTGYCGLGGTGVNCNVSAMLN